MTELPSGEMAGEPAAAQMAGEPAAAAAASDRPELLVGAAFLAGLMAAILLKRLVDR
jgi:hypothetical protein